MTIDQKTKLEQLNWTLALIGKKLWLRAVFLSKELKPYSGDEEYQQTLDDQRKALAYLAELQKTIERGKKCLN